MLLSPLEEKSSSRQVCRSSRARPGGVSYRLSQTPPFQLAVEASEPFITDGICMTKTLIVTGSPSGTSRTAKLAGLVAARLSRGGIDSSLLDLRGLPAEDLLHARSDAPAIKSALD